MVSVQFLFLFFFVIKDIKNTKNTKMMLFVFLKSVLMNSL